MNDDELRERLHAMPEPATAIDVDAVVADARRRRRPKVVGMGVAAVAGCLAFLAPVVVPGLLGPDPVTSSLQEQGTAEQAPAATAPGDAASPDSGEQEESTTLGAPVDACAARPIDDDLALGYVLDDDERTATITIQNLRAEPVDVAVGDVGVGSTVDGALVVAPAVDPASAATSETVTLEPMASHAFEVPALPATAACASPDPTTGDGGILTIQTIVVALAVDGVPYPYPVLPGSAAPVEAAPATGDAHVRFEP